jgi:hypothetical protein
MTMSPSWNGTARVTQSVDQAAHCAFSNQNILDNLYATDVVFLLKVRFANMQSLVDHVSSLISRGTLVLHARRSLFDSEKCVPSIDSGIVTQGRDIIWQIPLI